MSPSQSIIKSHDIDVQILLTGGTGSFGRSLLRHWNNLFLTGTDTPHITVLSRSPETFLKSYPEFRNQPWLNFHCGNILEYDSLPQNKTFTHVLHAAADSTLESELSSFQRFDQIVNGTRNLLDFSVSAGISRFLFTSSGSVYGKQPNEMQYINENYNGMPDNMDVDNTYGVAKRTAEHLCAMYNDTYDIETVIARCFTFLGRDFPLDAHFAIGNFIRDALWRDSIVVSGDGSAIRSYLDQSDLAEWLLTLLEKGQACTAYNVGSDQAISIAELAHLVRNLVAPEKPVHILGKAEGKGAGSHYVPDINRAKTQLGLNIKTSLRDAIILTAKTANQ